MDEQFYKELYTFEDWQAIDKQTFENYKLMSDIDFDKKDNINIGVNIARLDGNNHALKNMNVSLTGNQTGIINTVKTELKNINFENISINNIDGNRNIGIIVNNTGDISKVSFTNITINAPYAQYVACITKNDNSNTSEIKLNNVNITGKNYISGFIAETYAIDMENIVADNVTIKGSDGYIGGIFGNILNKQESMLMNITLTNSNVQGSQQYVGGIVGYVPYKSTSMIWLDNVKLDNNYISGNDYVGGVSGYSGYERHIEVQETTVKGNNFVGGISGYSSLIYDAKFLNSDVEGIGNYVGGILGMQINVETSYNLCVNGSNISSSGDNVGGLVGSIGRELRYSYVENSNIKGRNNVGTLLGNNNFLFYIHMHTTVR